MKIKAFALLLSLGCSLSHAVGIFSSSPTRDGAQMLGRKLDLYNMTSDRSLNFR